jgi:hypothetical protein
LWSSIEGFPIAKIAQNSSKGVSQQICSKIPDGGQIFFLFGMCICFFHTSGRNTLSLYTNTSGLAWAVIICLAGIGPFAVLLPRQPLATSFDINLLEMEAINFTLHTYTGLYGHLGVDR